MKLFITFLLFTLLHVGVWFSSNTQLMSDVWKARSFWIMIALAIPTSLLAYYATRIGYSALGDSVWSLRFIGFGTSYLVFPVLTWLLLGESMFTLKTMLCIALSFVIVAIQLWMPS
jgi:drug/metabolite transporter (DMT)-like permease